MRRYITLIFALIATTGFCQSSVLHNVLSEMKKGEYVILEVRMQLEGEIQTLHGNESANLSIN